ncbi:hypothetical protein IMSHALPRED_007039 [Imshaugia aleurites]|uniref:Uncharacterized protein n=1 Tax=Imshaugia aleurites TaxID=172621 RepID=A0A8H3IG42_9LECA|nr:hypothetical protein IMSHALPRED_007039 [Imshaugia aleurites]
MPDTWQGEEAQARQLPSVDGQSEYFFLLGGEARHPVVRFPVEPALRRASINSKTFTGAPSREGHDHAMKPRPTYQNEPQSGVDYQRANRSLDESALIGTPSNNGAVSEAPFGVPNFPTNTSHRDHSQDRALFEIPIPDDLSGRVPWVASPFSFSQWTCTYPSQETALHTQRPIFLGPGIKPRNFAGPSSFTPSTSNFHIRRLAGSSAWQRPQNEPTANWVNSTATAFVARGRLPYQNQALENCRIGGLVQSTSLAGSRAPFFIGSHSSSRYATAASYGHVLPAKVPNAYIDDTDEANIDGLGMFPAPTLADRLDERYHYFSGHGIKSRSFPSRSRSQSRAPIKNRRPQSSPPHQLPQ